MYKEFLPSKRTVEFWAGEFKRPSKRTVEFWAEDDPREGRQKTATTQEIIEQVYNIVSEDSSLTKREIANAIGISGERVLHILHGELHMYVTNSTKAGSKANFSA